MLTQESPRSACMQYTRCLLSQFTFFIVVSQSEKKASRICIFLNSRNKMADIYNTVARFKIPVLRPETKNSVEWCFTVMIQNNKDFCVNV